MVKKRSITTKPKKLMVSAAKRVEKRRPAGYNQDFFKWTEEQSQLLKQGDFKKLDILNLVEEIESLGRSQRDKLESYLTILLMHLLKIKYQPTQHSKSWDLSVKNSAFHARRTLEQNPSLKSKLSEIYKDAYYSARLMAAQETGLDESHFPETAQWTVNKILSVNIRH